MGLALHGFLSKTFLTRLLNVRIILCCVSFTAPVSKISNFVRKDSAFFLLDYLFWIFGIFPLPKKIPKFILNENIALSKFPNDEKNIHIYIYIYRERERERERNGIEGVEVVGGLAVVG